MQELKPRFEVVLADGAGWAHYRCEADQPGPIEAAEDLDPNVAEALVANGARARFSRLGDGFVLVLRGVNMNPGADPEDMISVRIWATQARVVTADIRQVLAVGDVHELSQRDPIADTGAVVAELSEAIERRIYPVVDELDDEVDALQEELLAKRLADLPQRLGELRRVVTLLRRHLAPQRDALARMLRDAPPWIAAEALAEVREVADRSTRYVEVLDSVRDRAAVVQDQIDHLVSERLNRNMYLMSVIAALFLPLSFVTGLLGVNVAGIPGAENAWSFWLLCGGLVVFGLVELWLLRRLRVL
ncbi:MAG: zinc transporter ZntB [Planctomycetes bacterium]|nr:zinc transporter ZntB [Planctomycetota bacterium]